MATKPKLSDKDKPIKPKSQRIQLTDLIKSLYDSRGISNINWGCEGNRIELLKKGNLELNMTDEGIKKCLHYIVHTKMIDVFDNNGGSILNLVPYYYLESKLYDEQVAFVNELIKRCENIGYKSNKKDSLELLSSLQRIMRKNKDYKIATLDYMIDYLTNVKEYTLFNDNRITILGAIEYNYDEAKDFYLKCAEIKKLANEFDFDDKIRVVKIGNREKKIERMEFD